jgi:hypothetical protein
MEFWVSKHARAPGSRACSLISCDSPTCDSPQAPAPSAEMAALPAPSTSEGTKARAKRNRRSNYRRSRPALAAGSLDLFVCSRPLEIQCLDPPRKCAVPFHPSCCRLLLLSAGCPASVLSPSTQLLDGFASICHGVGSVALILYLASGTYPASPCARGPTYLRRPGGPGRGWRRSSWLASTPSQSYLIRPGGRQRRQGFQEQVEL